MYPLSKVVTALLRNFIMNNNNFPPMASIENTVTALVHITINGIKTEENPSKNITNLTTKCYQCEHARSLPGNYHILCSKPHVSVSGSQHALANGWFTYPVNFDPTWRTTECPNFQQHNFDVK